MLRHSTHRPRGSRFAAPAAGTLPLSLMSTSRASMRSAWSRRGPFSPRSVWTCPVPTALGVPSAAILPRSMESHRRHTEALALAVGLAGESAPAAGTGAMFAPLGSSGTCPRHPGRRGSRPDRVPRRTVRSATIPLASECSTGAVLRPATNSAGVQTRSRGCGPACQGSQRMPLARAMSATTTSAATARPLMSTRKR